MAASSITATLDGVVLAKVAAVGDRESAVRRSSSVVDKGFKNGGGGGGGIMMELSAYVYANVDNFALMQ
jgi:hypothetical protein